MYEDFRSVVCVCVLFVSVIRTLESRGRGTEIEIESVLGGGSLRIWVIVVAGG